MRAIIVDDEPKAIALLEDYLKHFSSVKLLNTFRNGLKAFEFISSNEVDLIFLDINMPHLSGMSLSKMLPPGIKVVFTTAYSEYAVESYDVKAADYLLKPISLQRFGQCMTRLLDQQPSIPSKPTDPIIHIKSGAETHLVSIQDCLFLKKDGNYMHYQTTTQNIMARQTIAEALEVLDDDFIQVHKSYIVNLKRVNSYGTLNLKIEGFEVPIGETFVERVKGKLKS